MLVGGACDPMTSSPIHVSCLGNRYMNLLVLLGRLRSLCCDPRLLGADLIERLRHNDDVVSPGKVLQQAKTVLGDAKVELILAKLRELQEDECVICLEAGGNVVTRCSHVYHRECIEKSLQSSPNCPLCRAPVSSRELIEHVEEKHPQVAGGSASAAAGAPGPKIEHLLAYVRGLDPGDKVVVFSSFVRFLDLIGNAMEAEGHSVQRLDGRMTAPKRAQAQSKFVRPLLRFRTATLSLFGRRTHHHLSHPHVRLLSTLALGGGVFHESPVFCHALMVLGGPDPHPPCDGHRRPTRQSASCFAHSRPEAPASTSFLRTT